MTQTWNKQPGPAGPLLVCKWGCDRTGRTARGHTGGHSRVQAHALVPSGLVLGVSSLSSLALSIHKVQTSTPGLPETAQNCMWILVRLVLSRAHTSVQTLTLKNGDRPTLTGPLEGARPWPSSVHISRIRKLRLEEVQRPVPSPCKQSIEECGLEPTSKMRSHFP